MNKDHSDAEVKGIDRYIPTPTTKIITVGLITIPSAVFVFFQSQMGDIAPTTQVYCKLMFSLLASISSMLLVAFCLIINLAVIIYQSKHGRIYHYTYHAPEMNIKWLLKNARFVHYFTLSLIFFLGVFIGFLIK
jgi:hypothetical protein